MVTINFIKLTKGRMINRKKKTVSRLALRAEVNLK